MTTLFEMGKSEDQGKEGGEEVRSIRFETADWKALVSLGKKNSRSAQKQLIHFVKTGLAGDLLGTELDEDAKVLVEWFRANFKKHTDTQMMNAALEYYINDLQKYDMDLGTFLPKSPHIKKDLHEHLHAAEPKRSYKPKVK